MPNDQTPTKRPFEGKLAMCVGSILLTTALLLAGKVGPDIYQNIMTWCISAYVVGNVVAQGAFNFGGQGRPGLSWRGGHATIDEPKKDGES